MKPQDGLIGIGGWLRFLVACLYGVLPAYLILSTWGIFQLNRLIDMPWGIMCLVLLIDVGRGVMFILAAWSLIHRFTPKSVVYAHVALWMGGPLAIAIESLAICLGTGGKVLFDIVGLIISFACCVGGSLYLNRSRRVRNTYFASSE